MSMRVGFSQHPFLALQPKARKSPRRHVERDGKSRFLVVKHLREAVFRFRIAHLARLHRENSESLNDADHGDGTRARVGDMV